MTKTKLSGSVDMLHCYIDKQRQVNGMRAIRQRKREERSIIKMTRHNQKGKNNKRIYQLWLPSSGVGTYDMIIKSKDKSTKRQKLSDQIQRGFNLAKFRKVTK